jgi:hypothetical protein
MLGVDPHEVRVVPLTAPFDQDVSDFFLILFHHLLDVVNVPERQVAGARVRKFAKKDLAIVQENRLIFAGKSKIIAKAARHEHQSQDHQKEKGEAGRF